MLDQSINPDSLKYVISDYERNFLFKGDFANKAENIRIKEIMDFFYDDKSMFSIPDSRKFYGKNIYSVNNFRDYFLIKRFIKTFKTINYIKQSNRIEIVDAIIALIQEYKPYYIIRLDIKEFYESINRQILLGSLNNDSIYSESTLKILVKLFNMLEIQGIDGLPRGISISPVLSEYYLRPFDKICKNMDSVFYYARFVDDIIIFTTENLNINDLATNLPDGLTFHTKGDKSQALSVYRDKNDKLQKFSYLGYEFTLKSVRQNKSFDYFIDISPKKINKIKTRIVKSFLDYEKNKDFSLLLKRIRFLTHNFYIRNQYRDTKLKSGIYYNYKRITIDKFDEEYKTDKAKNPLSLNQLDFFLRKIIFDKKFSMKVLGYGHGLTKIQAKQIARLSFNVGFRERKFWGFTVKELKNISICWAY